MTTFEITGRYGEVMTVKAFTQSLAGDLLVTEADNVAKANGDRYSITHRASGLALGWGRNKREAEAILDTVSHAFGPELRRLRKGPNGWTKPTAHCKALGARVQALIGSVRGDGRHRSL